MAPHIIGSKSQILIKVYTVLCDLVSYYLSLYSPFFAYCCGLSLQHWFWNILVCSHLRAFELRLCPFLIILCLAHSCISLKYLLSRDIKPTLASPFKAATSGIPYPLLRFILLLALIESSILTSCIIY